MTTPTLNESTLPTWARRNQFVLMRCMSDGRFVKTVNEATGNKELQQLACNRAKEWYTQKAMQQLGRG